MLTDAAFEREFNGARKGLTRFAVYLTKGRDQEAQDLVQDVMFRAWRGRDRYDGRVKVYSWLCTILVNQYRDHARNAMRRPSTINASGLPEDMPFEALAVGEDLHFRYGIHDVDLQAAIDDVNPDGVEAFLMSEFEDVTYEEIAERQQVPIGTIRSRVCRARRQLAARLPQYA